MKKQKHEITNIDLSFVGQQASPAAIIEVYANSRFGARQVTEGVLTAGSLSKFVIYALYVGTNTGAVAQVVSQLIQVIYHRLPAGNAVPFASYLLRKGSHCQPQLLSRHCS